VLENCQFVARSRGSLGTGTKLGPTTKQEKEKEKESEMPQSTPSSLRRLAGLSSAVAVVTIFLAASPGSLEAQEFTARLRFAAPDAVPPEQTTFELQLIGDTSPMAQPLAAFNTTVSFDPALVSFVDDGNTFSGSVWEGADFQAVLSDPAAGTVTLAALADTGAGEASPPVPQGDGLLFARLTVQTSEAVPATCQTIAFGYDVSDIENNLVVDINAGYLDVESGLLVAARNVTRQPVSGFVRGNANNSEIDLDNPAGSVDVSDASFLLEFLFSAGPAVAGCLDAADANDDGRINLADPVTIFQALFGNSNVVIAPPYPGVGADPTEDTLTCESAAPIGCP
jgi:hypothetical protein